MGLLDLLACRDRPGTGVASQPVAVVRQALLALDRDTAPYTVRLARPDAFTEEISPEEVYRYRFNTTEITRPLRRAVTGQGWAWRKLAFSGF